MKCLSREQMLDLLTVARAASERDFLMILLAYRHGLRASEVCGFTTRDFSDGFVTIRRLKGSLKTVQPLFEDSSAILNEKAAITEYLKAIPKGQRLFPITRQHFHRLFQGYCKLAHIPSHLAHPHVCKHSAAMHAIRNAVGVENVRQFLGHKSLSSTGMYLRVDDKTACDAVAAAMANL